MIKIVLHVVHCLIVILTGMSLYGQPIDSQPVTLGMLPPQPTTAALVKFVEHPIDLSTGGTGIAIPLYSVQTPKLALPIGLVYHSGGFKVAERSS